MESIEQLVKSCTDLVSLPDVYMRVRQIVNDPEASMADVAKAISIDPAMTARVLKVVNSTFYGFPKKVETVGLAVSILGMQPIHDMVLATSVTSAFSRMSQEIMQMGVFWRNSVFCGLIARGLAKQCNIVDSERLFVEGLLRDLGHLVMYEKIPDLAQSAIIRAQRENQILFRIEREMIGFDFAQVGAFLMQEWNLPLNFQESIRFHTEPAKTAIFALEASILHIAGVLTDYSRSRASIENLASYMDPEARTTVNLSDDCLKPIIEEVEQELNSVVEMIYPAMQNAA